MHESLTATALKIITHAQALCKAIHYHVLSDEEKT